MAYNAVAQIDDSHDAASHSSDSDIPHHPSPPVALESPVDQSAPAEHAFLASAPLASLIGSINVNKSRSYEMVEDDDYDEIADPNRPSSPTTDNNHGNNKNAPATPQHASAVDASAPIPLSTSPKPLVRTSSGSSQGLRHPAPDLQSSQGAYVGNIERLEKSAERLSMTSSDLGVELRKLDLEQKRRSSTSSTFQTPESPSRQFSSGSISNSIIGVNSTARSGGYSPAAFLSSPRGSILSGSRLRSTSVSSPLQDIHEPQQGEEMVQRDYGDDSVPHLPELSQRPHIDDEREMQDTHLAGPSSELLDRPLTAHSTDTYQQATNLFLDFDGVHFVPHPREPSLSRTLSLNKPPLATTAEHYEKPRVGQDLIYYPAPIPKILNLPKRLSKRPPMSEHDKRRTQLLNDISATDKKDADVANNRANKRASAVPPQLRASVFFEQPSTGLSLEVKNKSAVDTLDSILDASAHAPVTAFTDHPIVGSMGREVYAKAEKKRSSRMLAVKDEKHVSRSTLRPDDNTLYPATASSSPGPAHSDLEANEARPLRDTHSDDGHSHSHSSDVSTSDSHSDGDETGDEGEEWEDGETHDPILFGRPTTLLAELEMRKHEQKQRTRTAATAFPNGMHSTLLQLDAVAQAQSNKRRQKHVTLAWEAEGAHDGDEADDEDIPLGVLYNKQPALEERPLGLMERRELEENEPLSRRRARLRGEAPPEGKHSSTMMQMQAPEQAESDSGDEGETLAQRLRRLKAEKKDKSKSIVSADFENEILAELGKLHEPVDPAIDTSASQPQETVVNEEEETLGQRRKRLQAEAQVRKSQSTADIIKTRRSMADILQAYPTANAHSSFDRPQTSQASLNARTTLQPNRFPTTYTLPPSMMYHASLDPQGAYGNNPYNSSAMGMANRRSASMIQPVIDPNQRDVIDRWRQSVMR